MCAHLEKQKKSTSLAGRQESRAVANSVTQNKNSTGTLSFIDNRTPMHKFTENSVAGINQAGVKECIQMTKKVDALANWKIHSDEKDDAQKDVHLLAGKIPIHQEDGRPAEGLLHAVIETRRAAERHYNEINFVADNIGKNARLGVSNDKEPDAMMGNEAVEVKSNDTSNEGDVDKLVVDGLRQLGKRDKDIDGTIYSSWRLKLYINKANNYWPWTSSESSSARFNNKAKLKSRTNQRTVFPRPGVKRWVTVELTNLKRPSQKEYKIYI